MYLIYAEKADIGSRIAAALDGFTLPSGELITFRNLKAREKEVKNFQRKQGYLDITFRGEASKVTWGYGHLYGLQDVPEYNIAYKSWRTRPTCFIPDNFQLHATSSGSESFDRILDTQRRIVKDLLKKADHVICATDYDREGELIFAYVCEASGYKKPFSRVLFTSTTEEGLQKAFDSLIPSSEVQNVERAGRARSIYDWLIGTNLSTQMTLRCPGNGVLSVGRVQTPVLKMVVDREEEIAAFVPKISWNIKGTFKTPDGEYTGLCKGNGNLSRTDAESLVASIRGQSGTVTKLEKKKSKREVPLLYSQTTLQMDANKYFGYTAKQTLDAAQYLYDNGYASYPRTKSQHLTDDMKGDAVKILRNLSSHPDYHKFLDGVALSPAPKFFDSSKVISHFAIIPTTDIPDSLAPEHKNVYDLIVWSLIRTIYPDAVLEKTSVVTTVDGKHEFISSGISIVEPGWLAVNVKTKETFLPDIRSGASYPGVYEGKETKTEPPKRYDDGSLVKAMKTAGKDLDDAAFRAILADPDVEGIGTDATRAEIIETLVRRQYIERRDKKFYATEKGSFLVHNIPVPDMMSAEFTARMEQSLSRIEKGELDYDAFLNGIYEQTRTWCDAVAACSVADRPGIAAVYSGGGPTGAVVFGHPEVSGETSSSTSAGSTAAKSAGTKSVARKISSAKALKCPKCGGSLTKGPKAWNCDNPSCDFHIFFTLLEHKLKDKEVRALVAKRETDIIKDFVSKRTGKQFSAKLKLNKETWKIDFIF